MDPFWTQPTWEKEWTLRQLKKNSNKKKDICWRQQLGFFTVDQLGKKHFSDKEENERPLKKRKLESNYLIF